MKRIRSEFYCAFYAALCGAVGVVACCAYPSHLQTAARSAHAAGPCFDPSDSSEVRLWDGRAPGAIGDDPCRDIPYVRVFPPQSGNSKAPGPAILIIPGGGYDRLTDGDEQAPVAEYFARKFHVTAFLLRYRLVQPDGAYRYPIPMWDGQRAIKMIRHLAPRYNIDPDRVAVFGFSAGGHLASTLALHSAADFDLPAHDAVDSERARPDLLGLGYAVISMDPADVPTSGSYRNLLHGYHGAERAHLESYLSGEKNVTAHTPPVFLFESMDDARISAQNSVLFVDALQKARIPVESHLFPHGKHGDGLATGIAGEDVWPEMYGQWLGRRGFL